MPSETGRTELAGDFSNITLCAVSSTHLPLTAQAMERCQRRCRFGDALLLSHVPMEGAFRSVTIPKLESREAYSRFMIKDLARFIETPFALIVQWDGYVLDAAAWLPEFCDYDYIGAKWHWHGDGLRVGNGGFSLRSKQLLDLLARLPLEINDGVNEDVLIGQVLRPALEKEHGIRFASEAVADRFSYERSLPETPTFGFHGLFNLWRHVTDDELAAICEQMDPAEIGGRDFAELLVTYYQLRKWQPLMTLFRRWQAVKGIGDVTAVLQTVFGADGAAFAARCEKLAAG